MASPTSPSPGSGSASGPRATVDDLTHAAADSVRDVADQARDAAERKASDAKDSAEGVLGDVADALHQTGDALRDSDHGAFARYAEAAATQVEQFTDAIRGRSVGELLDEAEAFARREPGLFVGGAFLLGIAGARFLKAGASGGRTSRGGMGTGTRSLLAGMSMPGPSGHGSVANVNRPEADRSRDAFAASGSALAGVGHGLDTSGSASGRGALSGGSLPAGNPAVAGSEGLGTALGTGTATSARSGSAADERGTGAAGRF